MQSMIQETYHEYLRLRHATDPVSDANRLRRKATLARDITTGQGDWYLQRLAHGAYGKAANYGELAASLSDTRRVKERKEPSLAEAVLATRLLEADYKELSSRLLPRSRAIIQVGSTSWAKNYDVRLDPNNPSDLDVEVLADRIHPDIFTDIPELQEGMEMFMHYFFQGEADYFAASMKKDGRPISIHVMPTTIFEENCQRDYFTGCPQNHYLREFRTEPKSKPPVYVQRNGNAHLYQVACEVTDILGGQITKTPLMVTGDQEEIVLGLTMDKYLAYPTVEGDQAVFDRNVRIFKNGLAHYAAQHDGSLANYPSRRDRMPFYILHQLEQEQREILYN